MANVMKILEDLTGLILPEGEVLRVAGKHIKGYLLYDVICARCGFIRTLSSGNIKRSTGLCQSCANKNFKAPVSINGHRTAEYIAWCGIMERCGIWKGKNSYVEKGIEVCKDWVGPSGYENFYLHIGPKPDPSMVLDRINNSGNYEPGNVRWATPSESNKNKSNARLLTINGETKNLCDWALDVGISPTTIVNRLNNGWTVEQAIYTKPNRSPYNRPDVDEWYLNMTEVIKQRATCIRREVGCILVDSSGYILSTGYNSVPTGIPHCIEYPCKGAGGKSGTDLHLCQAVHAEEVALIKCKDIKAIHTCYVSTSPCEGCIRKLLNTTCQRIVFIEEYPHTTSKTIWENAGREWLNIKLEKFNADSIS